MHIIFQVGDSIIFHARSNQGSFEDFHFLIAAHGQIVTSKAVAGKKANLVTFDERAAIEMTPSATAFIWRKSREGNLIAAQFQFTVSSQSNNAVSEKKVECQKSFLQQFNMFSDDYADS